jgi:TRAP-type mannitol/chloroaromatic compound transport system permease small subunit
MQAVIDRLEAFSEMLGRAISWATLAMVLVTFLVVVLRYAFDIGLIWLQESVIWMHALVFMMGSAFTLRRDQHVRVDVFLRGFSERGRAIVNSLGVLFLLWPMCGFLAWASWDFVAASWSLREASRESGGLVYPWLPLIKCVLVAMPVTVGLQGLALLLRSVIVLRAR